ncbi:MAG: flagellar hook-associated protein FlgK [Verrucomicrobiota bacterium]
MLGLFGTLNLAKRSLQTQQEGIEVTGHNLANVNNPAYSRQRISIQTSSTVPTSVGPQGNGADVVSIQQLRSGLVDRQIQTEVSVTAFLESRQTALQYAQANLGQQIDSKSAVTGISGQPGIAQGLSDLFAGFQDVATSPTSPEQRQSLLVKAQSLAGQFNQVDQRLSALHSDLNNSLQTDIGSANKLMEQIAHLNDGITNSENGSTGVANDLRDARQQKVEELAKLVNIETAIGDDGSFDVSIGGASIIAGKQVVDNLETYDAGGGQLLVRTRTAQTPLTLTSGSAQGTIDARDGAVASLRSSLDRVASSLISEVNLLHSSGFGLTGSTGADFFTGTDAATMKVNGDLMNNPALVQAAGVAGAVGDNQVANKLAALANQQFSGLGNQTFSASYGQLVASLGEKLSTTNDDLGTQNAVQGLLMRQRDSVSGVSLDEEMTELTKFQKAFTASARIVTTIDEMFDTVLSLKR